MSRTLPEAARAADTAIDESTGRLKITSADTQSTVGAAGGASALPATPTGYIKAIVNGTTVVIPYYAAA